MLSTEAWVRILASSPTGGISSPKGNQFFGARWWIASDERDPSRCACKRPMAFTINIGEVLAPCSAPKTPRPDE